MGLGPYDLTGGPFLALYAATLVLAALCGLLLPSWLRAPGRNGSVQDLDQLAYLAGGKIRMVDAAVARLLASKALVLEGTSRFRSSRSAIGETRVERAIIAAAQPAKWPTVARRAGEHGDPIRQQLVNQGLLIDRGAAWQRRFLQTLPLLAAFAFGLGKLIIGEMRNKPVGYLAGLLVLTALIALWRFAAVDRRTASGQALLAEEQRKADRVRRAPLDNEAGVAVALFGTAVLAGSPLAEFHKLRQASSSDGGGSSGSDGGSGCGGGCGGCGG